MLRSSHHGHHAVTGMIMSTLLMSVVRRNTSNHSLFAHCALAVC
jgi:hypothetical protein